MMTIFKKACALLPKKWQYELKRLHYARLIKKGIFLTSEPEYKMIPQLINPGDCVIVIDVGANIGYYTKIFSELVGPNGRVISIEPVPTTFSLLAANCQLLRYSNVSLINAACSDKQDILYMDIPSFSTGLKNFYQATVSYDSNSELSVLALPLDSLSINQRVTLIKIDVEGYESKVLNGMLGLIRQHHPILIIETSSQKIIDNLSLMDYSYRKIDNSPNILFEPLATR